MIKISFFLKKPNDGQENLEHITIDDPKKILEGKKAGLYACEVRLPNVKESCPVYSVNPVDAFYFASETIKTYLQSLIFRGFIISEPENCEPWKLEKKDPQLVLQEKIEAIKNNKDMSEEDKQKILNILKGSFGGSFSPIKDQINKLI